MGTEPVGLSRDLAPRGVMRARTGQSDVAVWRSQGGVVSAWDNRCPHRGMRLSQGFVRGESLACAYHGWHYSCSGQCHYIPAHPELEPPATIRPLIYSVIESTGVLWVNTSDNATPVLLPDALCPVRSININSNVATVEAAFRQFSQVSANLCHVAVRSLSDDPRVLSFSTADHNDAVVVLFQQPENNSVFCHVLAATELTTDQLIAVSRWCESIRRQAET